MVFVIRFAQKILMVILIRGKRIQAGEAECERGMFLPLIEQNAKEEISRVLGHYPLSVVARRELCRYAAEKHRVEILHHLLENGPILVKDQEEVRKILGQEGSTDPLLTEVSLFLLSVLNEDVEGVLSDLESNEQDEREGTLF